jgi:hypothetical protein
MKHVEQIYVGPEQIRVLFDTEVIVVVDGELFHTDQLVFDAAEDAAAVQRELRAEWFRRLTGRGR